jgi:hypothetical protein
MPKMTVSSITHSSVAEEQRNMHVHTSVKHWKRLLLTRNIWNFITYISAKVNLFYIITESDVWTGLPDGIFSNQKSQFGLIFEGLLLDDVSLFFRPFGLFYGQSV